MLDDRFPGDTLLERLPDPAGRLFPLGLVIVMVFRFPRADLFLAEDGRLVDIVGGLLTLLG